MQQINVFQWSLYCWRKRRASQAICLRMSRDSLTVSLISRTVLFELIFQRWHQELKDDIEEPLQDVFHFKHDLGSTNRIFCNLVASVNQIIDGFVPCQTCRSHGLPLDDGSAGNKTKRSSSFCPITCQELGSCNLIETAMRVGEQTIMFLPSFESCPNLRQISAPISFTVIERTNLGSLSEGVIIGNSYVLTPSACHEMETTSDESDKSELNTQRGHWKNHFQVLIALSGIFIH